MSVDTVLNKFVEETGGWVATQLEACTRCGICGAACHFYQATGEGKYAPVYKMDLLRKGYEQRFTPIGMVKAAIGFEKRVTDDDLKTWMKILYEGCTVCNKCSLACPMGIDIGPILHNVRTGLAAANIIPEGLRDSTQKQIDIGSPLGVTADAWKERVEWIADEFEADIPIDKKDASSLLIFTSIEMMKFPAAVAAIAKILNTGGENWTLSSKGREVVNFGFFEGDMGKTRLLLNRVFDAAKELGVKKIIISECGHAYEAFRWTAKNIMEVPDVEITHIVAVTDDLINKGKLKIREGASDKGTITYHDSCKIQRRGGHIQEPRNILNKLAPGAFKEMSPNKEQSQCCAAGGGVISVKEADSLRFAAFGFKIKQLEELKADTVCMSCSNCRLQFTEGITHYNYNVKVKSLSEMVAEAIVE